MPTVDLFLGGFGTGANRIMATLNANAALLASAGVTVPNGATVRDGFTNIGHRIGEALDRRGVKPDQADIAALSSWIIQQKSQAPERLLLADRDMVGIAKHLAWQGLLYHRKNPFFQALRSAWAEGPSTVYIGIRAYDPLFSEAWCAHAETTGDDTFVPPEKTASAVIRRSPSWVSFAKSMAELLPQTEIVLWQADDHALGQLVGLEAMFGKQVVNTLLLTPAKAAAPDPMSHKAFEIFRDIYIDSGEHRARAEWANIREVYDTLYPTPTLSIFSEKDREALNVQYTEDCLTLATLGGQIRMAGAEERVTA